MSTLYDVKNAATVHGVVLGYAVHVVSVSWIGKHASKVGFCDLIACWSWQPSFS